MSLTDFIDLSPVVGKISAQTVQAYAQSPFWSGLAISGASSVDVMNGALSNYALGVGGHCSYGTRGIDCGLGSGASHPGDPVP